MNTNVLTAVLSAAVLASLTLTFEADARQPPTLKEVDGPPMGEARWIAPQMRINGLPMSLKSFDSRLSVDAALSHYESWAHSQGIRETRRMRRGEWVILAMQTRREHITVELRPTLSGSQGTITVSLLPHLVVGRARTAFPHPPEARIVNVQQYEDAGVRAEHISFVSPRAVYVESREFAQALQSHGWHILIDQQAKAVPRAHAIEAQRGAEHVFLLVQPDQSRTAATAIIAVWRKP